MMTLTFDTVWLTYIDMPTLTKDITIPQVLLYKHSGLFFLVARPKNFQNVILDCYTVLLFHSFVDYGYLLASIVL